MYFVVSLRVRLILIDVISDAVGPTVVIYETFGCNCGARLVEALRHKP